MNTRTKSTTARKAKKSYTLSPDSVAFLEALRKNRRAASVSAILEEILQTARREQERASVERAVTDYYGSLSGEEAMEQSQWGEFALREFPKEGCI
jgi:DNA-binding PadR family transcriptional regulator